MGEGLPIPFALSQADALPLSLAPVNKAFCQKLCLFIGNSATVAAAAHCCSLSCCMLQLFARSNNAASNCCELQQDRSK